MIELAPLTPMLLVWAPVLALGVLVSFYTFRAWRKEHSRAMLALGSGFLLLSIVPGTLWFGLYLSTDDAFMAELGCAAVMAGGFAAIVYALRTRFA
ncbi:MAG: hypothetical protein L3K15_00890 [Thermoplasmata archaeon]|nr:hypothetical protein [Thermoplasmata archaeon]